VSNKWIFVITTLILLAVIAGILNGGFGVWDRLHPEVTDSMPTVLPKAGDTKTVNDITFIYIPAGSFTMGADDVNDGEDPSHTVNVSGFWMMQTEVTKEQYRRCIESGPCTEPRDDWIYETELNHHPVVGVTWHQASTYTEWIDGRLPTEAEWEYACRGPDGRTYPWGNEEPSDNRLNYFGNVGFTTEVGSYPAGTNGLYDMAGNAWEWTSTIYQPYPYNPNDGRENLKSDGFRTLRGGSFRYSYGIVRCSNRLWYIPYDSVVSLGFRVVLQ